MASALRFAARNLCGRAFQRPPQPNLTAAVKEEQRRLFPSSAISHGAGSSLRRFSSSESPNLVNNSKHVPNSASGAGAAESSLPTSNTGLTSPPPLWSPRNKKFTHVACWSVVAFLAASCAIIEVETRLHLARQEKQSDDINKAE